jgi:hypothetical protein
MYVRVGGGLLNSTINKLPIELHVPGYQYCGPGTKLKKRLARGDPGINGLDVACKAHDIAYAQHKSLTERHKADKVLEEAAWKRVKSADAKLGEKATAWAVTTAMKIKRKLGMGIKKPKGQKEKKITTQKTGALNKVAQRTRVSLKQKLKQPNGLRKGSAFALKAAKAAVKEIGGVSKIRKPRIISIPKYGGFLPLVPIFAGLSALGALSGGVSGIVKAVNDAKNARKNIEESTRHNKAMESIAIGRTGSGLYMKPYRKGYGLYVKQNRKTQKNF